MSSDRRCSLAHLIKGEAVGGGSNLTRSRSYFSILIISQTKFILGVHGDRLINDQRSLFYLSLFVLLVAVFFGNLKV
ncbi:MAG: hypothetical protein ACRC6M_03000 [Microcystaceae cyanobacterium]